MKTVTKEEVERVFKEHSSDFTFQGADKMILNELFPPEFKVDQYAIRIWPSGKETLGKVVFKNGQLYWQCEESYEGEGGVEKGGWYGLVSNYTNGKSSSKLRHATPEEIAEAEWKEGAVYKVYSGSGWYVRIASDMVGWFYCNGRVEGSTTEYTTYEKIV